MQVNAAVVRERSGPFVIEALQLADAPLNGNTEGRSFQLVTVTAGRVRITCNQESEEIGRFETVLIAGHAGAYRLEPIDESASLLRASVPNA